MASILKSLRMLADTNRLRLLLLLDREELSVAEIQEILSMGQSRISTQLAQLKQAYPDVAVVIRPDRELPVQKLIMLMDTLRRAQITKVGIATRAETK